MSHKIIHTLQKYLPSRQNNLITNMSSSLMFVTVASYMKVEGFHTKCYDALYIEISNLTTNPTITLAALSNASS